jgi:hypothetical protein
MRRAPVPRLLLGLAWLLALLSRAEAAGTLTMAWDAPTTYTDGSAIPPGAITGYTLYLGTTSGVYPIVRDVGLVTQATVTGLNDGLAYYAVVTAYDSAHQESAVSTPEVLVPVMVVGGTLTMAWDAPTTYTDGSPIPPGAIAGYLWYLGTSSGVYTLILDVGLVTQATATGLNDALVYYSVVTAYDSAHVESAVSMPEVVIPVTPLVGPQVPQVRRVGH